MRLMDSRPYFMVVPYIGIVVHNHSRCAAPLGPGLQEVDHVDAEGLLIMWVGITSMPVLVSRRLEETYGREIARFDRSIKVVYIIIVVCRTGVSYFGNRRRPRVRRVCRRRRVLKKGVMRNVISSCPRKARRAPLAARGAVGVLYSEAKATHERSPSHTGGAQQIADILPSHAHHRHP